MDNTIRRVQVFKRPGSRSPNSYLRHWEIEATSGEPRERWKSTGTTVRKQADQQRRELEQQLERQLKPLHGAPSVGLQALSLSLPYDATWDAFEQSFLAYQQALKPPATVELYTIALRLFRRAAYPFALSNVTSHRPNDGRLTCAMAKNAEVPAYWKPGNAMALHLDEDIALLQ